VVEPTNEEIAAKAGELAKAANDGSTWDAHIAAARAELTKMTLTEAALRDQQQSKGADDEGKKKEEAVDADKTAENEETVDEGTDADKAEKVTPPGVKQVWTSSDGQTFEKKAEAEAHEATLNKTELTEAEKLAARLEKAMSPQTPEEQVELLEDFDRLGKVFDALSTPLDENGQPKLEKGMYTINRFSNVLSDMASLSRCIKAEGMREGDDNADATISEEIIGAVKSLGKSFISYATDQVKELLAGIDDDVLVTHYDYYYAAAKDDTENQLAKDVCGILEEYKDESRERREELSKAFGYVEAAIPALEDLPEVLQKRFDTLLEENTGLRKVAEAAVTKVEELAKRVQSIEETPLPRAPRNGAVAEKSEFLGKTVSSEEEKVAVLQDFVSTHGAEAVSTMLIKAAHASGGQPLRLKS
jgi:hypothetical protein